VSANRTPAIPDTRETLRVFARAFRYVAPFRGRFLVKVVLTFVSLAPLLVLPWPIKIVIDHVIEKRPIAPALHDYPFFLRPLVERLDGLSGIEMLAWVTAAQALLVLLVGAMGLTGRERDQTDAYLAGGHDTATSTENQANAGWSFAGGLLGLLDFRYTLRLSQAFNHHYRKHLFERIQSLPMPAFDDEPIGDAVYRVMYDTPSITEVVYRIVLTPLVTPVAMVVTAAMLWHVYGEHPAMFWTALAFLPGALLTTLPFAGLLRRREAGSREAGAVTTATVEEGMSNILAVQSLGGEARERLRFDRDSKASFGRYRGVIAAGMVTFLVALVPGIFLVRYAFLYVADLVVSGAITKGDFGVLIGYFFQMFFYAVEIGALWIRVQRGAVGLGRVFFLMDLPAEQDPPNARPLPRIREGVSIEDASFAYPDGTQALRGVSVDAPLGRVVALVGPAGAGKTTLAYLIPRFVLPQRGRVLVDGVDVAGVTRESLRAQIAFVFQENVLFDATIEENIRLGRPDASELEVRRAAVTAGADEFIRRLPDGYQTRLGRAGARLSVGQKQRLSIARALVRDAPILILDEPTSALDPETEQRLVDALRAASRTRLVLVIAHRLSTIRAADEILFLDRGSILERGTHAELCARPGGAYRRFVDLQTHGVAG
jgi:ABC-type multidrug transport system fused ATPase/permease subunit